MSNVEHPKHYNSHPSGIECLDIVERMPFCLGNAVKYLWRADLKGKRSEDVQKALFYLDRVIADTVTNQLYNRDTRLTAYARRLRDHADHGFTTVISDLMVAQATGSVQHLLSARKILAYYAHHPGDPDLPRTRHPT